MKKLYVQIINGIEWKIKLASQLELREHKEDIEEYNGCTLYRESTILIANDLDLNQALKTFAHEYTHAHRYSYGYDIYELKGEEQICDYVGANYYTIYHLAEHFGKHYKQWLKEKKITSNDDKYNIEQALILLETNAVEGLQKSQQTISSQEAINYIRKTINSVLYNRMF